MAYTASALSFLLEDIGKTVIVTGAQIPLGELRNDAVDNFLGSLILAGGYVIPEVGLYFAHTLYRGNRTRKVSSLEFEAFQSPNMEPLGVGRCSNSLLLHSFADLRLGSQSGYQYKRRLVARVQTNASEGVPSPQEYVLDQAAMSLPIHP